MLGQKPCGFFPSGGGGGGGGRGREGGGGGKGEGGGRGRGGEGGGKGEGGERGGKEEGALADIQIRRGTSVHQTLLEVPLEVHDQDGSWNPI